MSSYVLILYIYIRNTTYSHENNQTNRFVRL